jgi:3-methyladenine DNA glycosylase AlkD
MATTNKRATAVRKPPLPGMNAKEALAWLERHATTATRDGMARYALPSDHALGVTMADMKALSKQIGPNHEVAAALWKTGVYEARTVAALVDEPEQVTAAQMDRWAKAFDNWGICDTVCFALFDRTPHAWKKVAQWNDRREEYIKRAAFALLWGLTVHDKAAPNARFVQGLRYVEQGATDERHFVKKAVNMALRAIGKRNATLHVAAVTVARRLADSPNASATWVGKDALRELTSPGVVRRVSARAAC